MTAIGFIGLGNMGGPMAANLNRNGFAVAGFDLSEAAQAKWRAEGVPIVATALETATAKDVVITMLASGDQVRSVYADIVPVARDNTLFIDCSTIDLADARALHEYAAARGMPSLDAPVSGGVGGAVAGSLTFMVGGGEPAFEQAKPAFAAMGARAIYCGPAGSGQAAKICNNMLLGISMIGACEAFNLADGLGLSRQALFDVLSASSGQCWSVTTYCPVPGIGPQTPADRNYEPGFAAALMLKDLKLSQTAADGASIATPLGAHATELYADFAQSAPQKDFSGIIQALAKTRRAKHSP